MANTSNICMRRTRDGVSIVSFRLRLEQSGIALAARIIPYSVIERRFAARGKLSGFIIDIRHVVHIHEKRVQEEFEAI